MDSLVNPKREWKNNMARMTRRVEFREIQLRLPKPIIDYVQRLYGDPKQWLEYNVVDWIRIDVETKTEEELKKIFNLESAFKKVLG